MKRFATDDYSLTVIDQNVSLILLGGNVKNTNNFYSLIMQRIVAGGDLSPQESQKVMSLLLKGVFTGPQIASLLTALHIKGESVEELTGFASIMRQEAQSQDRSFTFPLLDTCGTGGGTIHTFNVSTAAAFVLAAGGVKVAKHGNRAITSKSGSADVLEKLGVPIQLSAPDSIRALKKYGVCFLFAPQYHPGMRFIQPIRKQLVHRTFFNILGPLANPFKPQYQVLGVFDPLYVKKVAETLAGLKTKRALVVHGLANNGKDSLDELSTLGPTLVAKVDHGKVTKTTIKPATFGIKKASPKDLLGGTVSQSSRTIEKLLKGKDQGPKQDLLALNAGAAFWVAEKVRSIKQGYQMAKQILSSGAAFEKLNALRKND